MRPDELRRVMEMPVNGVTGKNLRDEILYLFKQRRDLIPKPVRDQIEELDEDLLLTIIDVAAFAAQCRIRRTRMLPEPLSR